MTIERKFTIGDIIALGALLIAVIFGLVERCDLRTEIDFLKQGQRPYFIGSATWSYSASLRERGDQLLFDPLRRDLIVETDYWRKVTHEKPSAPQYYAWLSLENAGVSVATAKQLDLSYEWQGKRERVRIQVNRYARPGNRLFFLLFDFPTPDTNITDYLEQNLKFSENDVIITFSYSKPEGEDFKDSVWPVPILGPPAVAVPTQPKQQ